MSRPLTPLEIAGTVLPRWLRMSEACAHARMSRNTMTRFLREGLFSGQQINDRGDWRIDRESIDAYYGQGDQKALAILQGIRA